MSTNPHQVRCSPLGRREVVANVVATEWVADPNGIRPIHTVVVVEETSTDSQTPSGYVDGHRYRVDDIEPLED